MLNPRFDRGRPDVAGAERVAHVGVVVSVVRVRIRRILRILNAGRSAVAPRGEAVVGHIIERMAVGVTERCLHAVIEVAARGDDEAVVVGGAVGLQFGDGGETRVRRSCRQSRKTRGAECVQAVVDEHFVDAVVADVVHADRGAAVERVLHFEIPLDVGGIHSFLLRAVVRGRKEAGIGRSETCERGSLREPVDERGVVVRHGGEGIARYVG